LSSSNNGIHISGNQRDVIGVGVQGNANIIGKNISIGRDITVNKNKYENLEPEFKNSLDDFLALINKKSRHLTEEQKKSISEIVDKLAKEYQSVKPDEEIKDEDKKVEIKYKQISLAEKVVDLMPDVTEYITSVTPLAPFGKAIGKGASYFGDLIKKEIDKQIAVIS
jgi:hypothetical protein